MTSFMNYDLVFVKIDRLSLLFGYIFHLITFICIIYALHVKDDLEHMAGYLYAGSALGIIFAFAFIVIILWTSGLLEKLVATEFRANAIGIFTLVAALGGAIAMVLAMKQTPTSSA